MFRSSKSLSILLVLLSLIFAGCRGNSEEDLGMDDDAVIEASVPEAISSGTVTASLLNIHETPGTNTPILYEAPAGTEVDIFDETALGDSIWYQVRARSETLPSELGWAFSRYIDTGENSNQNYPSGNQPSSPPASGGSGSSSGGTGGLDPEAPGANPDTPGTIDPEAPGANPDTPGTIDPEAPGANPDTPGTIEPEAPVITVPGNSGGVGGHGGSGTSRPSMNDGNPQPATREQ
jgi:hypothetical protein